MSERPKPMHHEIICDTSDKKKDTEKLSKEIELIAIERANAYINEKIAILEKDPVIIKIIDTKLGFKKLHEECKKNTMTQKKLEFYLSM